MTVSRVKFLVAAGAAGAEVAALRLGARAAEFTFKLAHQQSTSHPVNIRMNEAAEKVAKDSGGRLEVKIFPSSQLGGEIQALGQLRAGALELQCLSDLILSSVFPVTTITSIPFAFAGYKELWRALDGPLGAHVRAQIAKSTIFSLGKGWDAGFREMYNSARPINTAEDFKGMKLRVPESPLSIATFKALGASPLGMPIAETYSALQTHLVDGGDLPLSNIEGFRYYEVSKYLSLTNHQGTSLQLLCNDDAFGRLPANLRDVLQRTFDAAALLARADIARGDDQLLVQLKGQGMIVGTPKEGSLRSVIQRSGLYTQWRDQYGPQAWGLLERAVGRLA